MKTVLYISYDGMTDPLGQSQVLPYLVGLSELDYTFVIVSFEKSEHFEKNRVAVAAICEQANIIWHPLTYTKKPPIFSTLWDVYRLKRTILRLHKQYHFTHSHCRSHISAIGGAYLKRKANVPFIFDMRGFYADERVDGNIWNLKNPIFKTVFNFFKRKERTFLKSAYATVSLTEAGEKIINSWPGFENIPIDVIPCCADQHHFNSANVDKNKVITWREKLKISESDFVVTYLGSIGTWYMADEMFLFFKRLLKQKSNAKFLLISADSASMIQQYATKHDIPSNHIVVQSAKRDEVPTLLSLSNISLFFIKPVFSKQASSPVKMGEILAMGIPIIANSGVGDVDAIIHDTKCGLLIDHFTNEAYDEAIASIDELVKRDKSVFTQASQKYYSLKEGVRRYFRIYERHSQY